MPKKVSALIAVFAMSSMLLFTAGGATAAPPAPDLDVPIEFSNEFGSFEGTFNVTRFAVQGGDLVAIGTLTGTVFDAEGDIVGTVTRNLTLPVLDTQASCEILDLTLGPLDLDLLGLVVHLDTVHLNITAEPGPGNLLGNLLCAIAGLLDSDAPLNTIALLLNQLLGLLG